MKKIIYDDGGVCPYCGSEDTTYIMDIEKKPMRIIFNGHCNFCNKSFKETYKPVYDHTIIEEDGDESEQH